ncbi:MAG: hypothetical protein VXV97_05515, partial [Pseudomonadota bacterium]|nr:hypothetical protein [Pseudomonadota bacterium]
MAARNPGDEFGDGNIHCIDGRAAHPVAHTGANAKTMDILQEARGARRFLQKCVVRAKRGITAKQHFFILWRRLSVGSVCDALGKRGEFRTQRYIHVAPRPTD